MNRAFQQLGQKIRGGIHQLGNKLKSGEIHDIGNKIKDTLNTGLRKGINTIGAVAEGVDKATPYLYGVAHAAGFGAEAMPLIAGAHQGLQQLSKLKNYATGIRNAINN